MLKKLLFLAGVYIFTFYLNTVSLGQDVITAGTGDSQGLLRKLADEFEKQNTDIKIEIPNSIGSGGGIKSVAEGKCELGRIARPIKEEEKKYNLNVVFFTQSPVVFVVNFSDKGIDNITYEQIVDIFSGKITSWDKLGGAKKKIYVANREDGDSSRLILTENIPGFKEITTWAGKVIYSTPEVADILLKNKDTIGYVPLSVAKEHKMNILKINGIYPSLENVKNKSYKLIVPFGLVWKGQLSGSAKKFVDFIFNPESRKFMDEIGAFPISR